MPPIRVYADTSVFGGVFDEEFQAVSQAFFDQVKRGGPFMRAKTFINCVEMKHRGAEKVREQTKDMTLEQEMAFWQERSRILKQRQRAIKGESCVPANGEQRAS